MNRNEFIKETAKEVLILVQKYIAPNAFIAGGMPRDLKLGKPIKDVDIFLPSSRAMEGQHYAKIIGNIMKLNENFDLDYGEVYDKYEDSDFTHIDNVVKMKIDGVDFDFIITNKEDWKFKPYYFVEGTFDFAICEAYIDDPNGSMEVITTSDFNKCVETGNIKYKPHNNPTMTKNSLGNHLPRLKEKFPEYSFMEADVAKIYNGEEL